LQTFSYDGKPVNFNAKVTYVCQRGQKFLDNFNQVSIF
jgi:hypothetical protein